MTTAIKKNQAWPNNRYRGCGRWWHQRAAAQEGILVCCCLPHGVCLPWRLHCWDIWLHWPKPCPKKVKRQQSGFDTVKNYNKEQKGNKTTKKEIKTERNLCKTIKKSFYLCFKSTRLKGEGFPLAVQRSTGNRCLDTQRLHSECLDCFQLSISFPECHLLADE